MSQKHYTAKWQHASRQLTQTLRIELPVKKPTPDKTEDQAYATVSFRYVRYTMAYNHLQKCLDYMVHPQKRKLVSQCLEGVTGRLIELKFEMMRLNLSTYNFLGAICHDFKKTPQFMEMQLPKSIYLERVASIRKRLQMLDYIIATMRDRDNMEIVEDIYTVEEAVLLIQKNQRCYHGRLRAKMFRKKMKRSTGKNMMALKDVNVEHVLRISSVWRGHCARKRMHDLRQNMDMSLNMLPQPNNARIEVLEETAKSARIKQAGINQDDFAADLIMKTEHMLEKKREDLARDIKDECMQWILECRDILNKFPVFPADSDGGSAALFKNMSMKKLEREMNELQKELAPSLAKDKAKDKPQEKPKPKKKKKAEITEFIMKPSKFVNPHLVDCVTEYGQKWYMRREEDNLKQIHDMNLLMEDVENNVERIVRMEVDEVMRQELERLQIAVDQQRSKKKKPKKEKKKKEPRRRMMRDLTPGVPVEELFKELVIQGIIKKVPNKSMSDYVGSHNLFSPTDVDDVPCLPDLGDIRKMVFDLGILPMSSSAVHLRAPLIKSLLLVGPAGSGKTLLTQIMSSELGATYFDLTAENLVDKYEGKKGAAMLINLVMKVGKEMEPSIIFIDDCDRMFSKKLTPEQQATQPGRLKNFLANALTYIGPEDRILLVGTSKFPFTADLKSWMRMFEHVIPIFPPSHSTRCKLWEACITEHKGVITEHFCLSAIAKVTAGYTGGSIMSCVREVLTERRRCKQHVYPLKCKEFVERLCHYDPVYQSELEAFKEWLTLTPMGVKREKRETVQAIGKVDVISII